MPRADVVEMFTRLRELNPHPKTELEYSSPFELLVAVALSAQATDVGVNKATRRLFPVANTPARSWRSARKAEAVHRHHRAVQRQGEERDRHLRDPAGEARRRSAARPRSAGSAAGCGPQDRQRGAQHRLRRAGDGGGHAYLPRLNRTGLAPGKNVREVEDKLVKVIPAEFLLDAHHWLILHGRYVQARKPDCPGCVIADLCRFKEKTTAET
jgi:endonuclease-3